MGYVSRRYPKLKNTTHGDLQMILNSQNPMMSMGPMGGQNGMGAMGQLGGMGGMDQMGAMTGMMMQMMQMSLMTQMMQMMQQLMGMVSGGSAISGASSFGGASGSASPSSFLGASESGGAAGAASVNAKDAGGGWTNPIGGKYSISSTFGPRKAPTAGASTNHQGIDLAAPLNTPILAAKAGTVSISKDEATGYGKWIEIKHDDGTKSRYGHLNSRAVQVGAKVAAGQEIGKMGSTGTSTGSHLHFEVINAQGQKVDPAKAMRL